MLLSIVPDNIVAAASSNNTILSVMFFALMLGIGMVLTRTEATETLKRGIQGLFDVSMTLIGMVIRLAPYAVACLMFNMTVVFGWDLLGKLAGYVAVVVAGAGAAHVRDLFAGAEVHRRPLAAGVLPRRAGSDAAGVLDRLQQRHPADRAARGRRRSCACPSASRASC